MQCSVASYVARRCLYIPEGFRALSSRSKIWGTCILHSYSTRPSRQLTTAKFATSDLIAAKDEIICAPIQLSSVATVTLPCMSSA
ncbi:hypothetical protein M407DRAFT_242898 [Tulasnella calospora MUT 4182]|uniref:Uncharacterized protein n=1 Tax=Tulasnella calospora MUT 4182 TaxID=1051891 RepID=A0A0C3QCX4_9AGAM|nr:hypothetical protein M407DRAFT_242898 [Tulasnella calospora MUT 4182]